MTGSRDILHNYRSRNLGKVAFAGTNGGNIIGQGTVSGRSLTLENVCHVPELQFNLLSVPQVCTSKQLSVHFTNNDCLFLKPEFKVLEDMILLRAHRGPGAYFLDLDQVSKLDGVTALVSKTTDNESLLWHRRLGHVNFKNLNKLAREELARGLPNKLFKISETCMSCARGKQARKSHRPKGGIRTKGILELLHMDLFGPVSVKSTARKSYCLVVTDDYSRFSWVYFLASKSETADHLIKLINRLNTLFKERAEVKQIRSDNGTEFRNDTLDSFCDNLGITRQFSAARTPQQNGIAERKNRTLVECARTMLIESKLPVSGPKQ